MAAKKHKYFRKLSASAQYIYCSGKRADFSEKVTYMWAKVECPKCLKLKGLGPVKP